MAERRDERREGDASGTAGGTDLEPLRGGMHEIERGQLGPEGDPPERRPAQREPPPSRPRPPEKDPPAPYHGVAVPEGGLSPVAEPGEGPTPEPARGEVEATAGRKVAEERSDLEREAGNSPRRDPAGRGVDE